MDIRSIKNDHNYFWTNHSKYKLLQYGLSPSLVKKVIRRPARIENGIAPNTTAVMIRKDGKKIKKEVWVMYQKKTQNSKFPATPDLAKPDKIKNYGSRIKIISAWIYPGVSPRGKDIYIPEDVWGEIKALKDTEIAF